MITLWILCVIFYAVFEGISFFFSLIFNLGVLTTIFKIQLWSILLVLAILYDVFKNRGKK
jgi:hypothetical protein